MILKYLEALGLGHSLVLGVAEEHVIVAHVGWACPNVRIREPELAAVLKI